MEEDKKDIIKLYQSGVSCYYIAQRYKINRTTIFRALQAHGLVGKREKSKHSTKDNLNYIISINEINEKLDFIIANLEEMKDFHTRLIKIEEGRK